MRGRSDRCGPQLTRRSLCGLFCTYVGVMSRLLRLAEASAERHEATPNGLVLVLSGICSVLPHLSCSYLFLPSILPYTRRLITGTERQIYDSELDTERGLLDGTIVLADLRPPEEGGVGYDVFETHCCTYGQPSRNTALEAGRALLPLFSPLRPFSHCTPRTIPTTDSFSFHVLLLYPLLSYLLVRIFLIFRAPLLHLCVC